MKTTYIAIVLALLILILCTAFDLYTKRSVRSLSEKIDKMDYYTRIGDHQRAFGIFKEIKNEWNKKEALLQLMTEHGELDFINEQISGLWASYENNKYDSVFQYIYTLSYFINHIYDKKKINVVTIL